MPAIRITNNSFTVDGQQIDVLVDGLEIDFGGPTPVVRCIIPADTLEVDLPDAVLVSAQEGLREQVAALRDIKAGLEALNREQRQREARREFHADRVGRAGGAR